MEQDGNTNTPILTMRRFLSSNLGVINPLTLLADIRSHPSVPFSPRHLIASLPLFDLLPLETVLRRSARM